ncbi:omega-amidase NIT2 isoform X2 [Hyposmocoma kahamanoa]|uniref:omega-amidase NIT2 isoform X2 n=1 Tax=Hyposmocoma kahamanoa TaxID=1477025 RepID=UPI000E6D84B0|nr:omega-amidase NIT2 isoform X2 [Hyposmocoma kahamanoa]
MLKRAVKVALVQMHVCEKTAKNLETASREIVKAKDKGAQLVVLPECFNSPYGTKYFKEYAEEIPNGKSCTALAKLANELSLCIIAGTIPEREGDKLYNTCTVWGNNGELLAKHRKVHLFDIDIPGQMTFKESEVLSPGNKITTFEYRGIKIGLGICYDLRFPEMAQIMSNDGCAILIYPGAFNLTTGPKHWELLARSRANDNQLWMVLVSPARDKSASYVAWGHSMVVDPWGQVVEQLNEKPGILYADIDLKAVDEVRTMIPIRNQKRNDLYYIGNGNGCK